MKTFLLVVVMVSLTGCGPATVYLKHPTTGEVKSCQGDVTRDWDIYAAAEACAKAHESAGYSRVGNY
ncbi:hypothetical protein GSbR_21420 [Geobacter sp. SVR]|nr:hypothetical protein GSVR_16400 [Geobacter sp. SVR]GCF85542.1 hypothetical protein GSbR_21420 [Geobacter sp. SVR]